MTLMEAFGAEQGVRFSAPQSWGGWSMTCPDCTTAQTNPDWGGYHANCQGCQVRAMAAGMEFFAARAERRITAGLPGITVRAVWRRLRCRACAGEKEYERICALRNASNRQ